MILCFVKVKTVKQWIVQILLAFRIWQGLSFINKHVACSTSHVVHYHISCRQCQAVDSIFCQNPHAVKPLTPHLRLSAVSCGEKTVFKKRRTIIVMFYPQYSLISNKLWAYKWFYSRMISWGKNSAGNFRKAFQFNLSQG